MFEMSIYTVAENNHLIPLCINVDLTASENHTYIIMIQPENIARVEGERKYTFIKTVNKYMRGYSNHYFIININSRKVNTKAR